MQADPKLMLVKLTRLVMRTIKNMVKKLTVLLKQQEMETG